MNPSLTLTAEQEQRIGELWATPLDSFDGEDVLWLLDLVAELVKRCDTLRGLWLDLAPPIPSDLQS